MVHNIQDMLTITSKLFPFCHSLPLEAGEPLWEAEPASLASAPSSSSSSQIQAHLSGQITTRPPSPTYTEII